MKLFGREFKFNNNKVYHAGDKPTPSEIGAASASHTHNSITNQDTRNVNTTPTQMPLGLSVHLKSNSTDGLNDGGTYHSTLMIKGWNDVSGGPWGQMAVTANNNLYFRSSNSDTWNAWKKVSLDGHTHSNYAASSHTHNYAGSSSAGGAANSANTLATARTINGTSFNGSANITTANWGTARTLTIGNTGKSVNGSGNVSWSLSEIGAFSSGGGDVGGNIHLTPNNAGITGVCGGGTDKWGIIGGGADDNGYLEINTKDNGNEPIYVRQYDANGLVRTAALLDGNGATSFPSKISVPIFHILNSPGSQNNAIFGGSGDAADWNTHNVVFKSHWGIGFRDYQDVCRIVFDTRSGNINTRGLLYSEGGISCTAWGHFNGSISADGGATIGSHTYINAMSVGDKITGETKFSKDGAWYDPWSGVGCAIKTHGNIAVTGIVRATDHMEINGTPISIQSSAPGCGGVWIQI